jgi:hypothetical protein
MSNREIVIEVLEKRYRGDVPIDSIRSAPVNGAKSNLPDT